MKSIQIACSLPMILPALRDRKQTVDNWICLRHFVRVVSINENCDYLIFSRSTPNFIMWIYHNVRNFIIKFYFTHNAHVYAVSPGGSMGLATVLHLSSPQPNPKRDVSEEQNFITPHYEAIVSLHLKSSHSRHAGIDIGKKLKFINLRLTLALHTEEL
jgi:hypothetical protein